MFEEFEIRFLGVQPTAKISDKLLENIIRRDYKTHIEVIKNKLRSIKSSSNKGKNRISAAVLKLSNGDINKIDSIVAQSNNDFRDIISRAEYPRSFELGFDDVSTSELKKVYLADWRDYSKWLYKS